MRLSQQLYECQKRVIDVAVCFAALVIVLPLLLVLIPVVKLQSPGPFLYRGRRAGLLGKPFYILKIRTMVVDAEQVGGGTTALNDSRIYPLGRFLRKYKLDELPQLLNVIKGDMSLVGPRPELMTYVERYTSEERVILTVRPGITDFSSVEFSALDQHVGAHDADLVFEERVLPRKNQLRVKYVLTRGFFTDWRIILMTVNAILRKFRPKQSMTP